MTLEVINPGYYYFEHGEAPVWVAISKPNVFNITQAHRIIESINGVLTVVKDRYHKFPRIVEGEELLRFQHEMLGAEYWN